jgi:hypothetical protein
MTDERYDPPTEISSARVTELCASIGLDTTKVVWLRWDGHGITAEVVTDRDDPNATSGSSDPNEPTKKIVRIALVG